MAQFTFSIAAGLVTGPNGVAYNAFSGHNDPETGVQGLNNPAACAVKGVGPLPPGLYAVGALQANHGSLGPAVMALVRIDLGPSYGRGSFYVHGASAVHPELSSDGCIIMSRTDRLTLDRAMAALGDRQLLVVGGMPVEDAEKPLVSLT